MSRIHTALLAALILSCSRGATQKRQSAVEERELSPDCYSRIELPSEDNEILGVVDLDERSRLLVNSSRRGPLVWDGTRHPLPEVAGYAATAAMDMNERGDVAGWVAKSWTSPRLPVVWWGDGSTTVLPIDGAIDWPTIKLTERGHVLVSTEEHAYLFREGAVTDLGSVQAWDVNDSDSVTLTDGSRGYLWRNGERVDLGLADVRGMLINRAGQITGHSERQAFLWEKGSARFLGGVGGTLSIPLAMNELGLVVGFAEQLGGSEQGVVWKGADVNAITAGFVRGVVHDINDNGRAIAIVWGPVRGFEPFLWDTDVGRVLPLPLRMNGYSSGIRINQRGDFAIHFVSEQNRPATYLWRNVCGGRQDAGPPPEPPPEEPTE